MGGSIDLPIPEGEIIGRGGPWRYPAPNFGKFLEALQRRKTRGLPMIELDITGQSLEPQFFRSCRRQRR